MPIYAYRCSACGHAKDALQKMSDPPLTTCPACGAEAFSKQVTAAGFQLKGSGWYVTDFRGGSGGGGAPAAAATASPDTAGTSGTASSDTSAGTSAPPAASASGGTPSGASATGGGGTSGTSH